MSADKMEEIMRTAPVIPVLTIDDPEKAVPMAEALVKGGLKVLEVTLRTQAATEVISRISLSVPEAIVGAGTVNTPLQVQQVRDAGAAFGVSPGATPALLDAAQKVGWPFLAGAATPSEVLLLLERGLTCMKFFPAQAAGGVPMLKSIGAPIPQAKFCPTGGIKLANAQEFLALDNVLCVGGSWVCTPAMIENSDWATVENNAREAAALG